MQFVMRVLALFLLVLGAANAFGLSEMRDTLKSLSEQPGGVGSILGVVMDGPLDDVDGQDPFAKVEQENRDEAKPMTLTSLANFVPESVTDWAKSAGRAMRRFPIDSIVGGDVKKLFKDISGQKESIKKLMPSLSTPFAKDLMDNLLQDDSSLRDTLSGFSSSLGEVSKRVKSRIESMLKGTEEEEELDNHGIVDLMPSDFIEDIKSKMKSMPDVFANNSKRSLLQVSEHLSQSLSEDSNDNAYWSYAPRPAFTFTWGISFDLARFCIGKKMDNRKICEEALKVDLSVDVGSFTLVVPFHGPVYGIFGTGWGFSFGKDKATPAPDDTQLGNQKLSYVKFFPGFNVKDVFLSSEVTVQFFFDHLNAPGAMWNFNVGWERVGGGKTQTRMEVINTSEEEEETGGEDVGPLQFIKGLTFGLADHCDLSTLASQPIKSVGVVIDVGAIGALVDEDIDKRIAREKDDDESYESPFRKVTHTNMNIGFSWGWGLAFPDEKSPITICEHEPAWIMAMVCYGNWGSPKTMRALNPLCNKDADEDIYSVECFCHSKSSDKAACDNQSKCTWDNSTDDAMKCKSAFGNRASADITWHDGYCNNPEGRNGLLQVADTTNALRLNKGRRLRGFRKPHSLLQTQGVTDVASEFAGQMLLSYLEKGNLSQAICIGKDEFCRANDDLRTIAGEFGTSLHPKHGAELKLHVPVIKAGAVAYLATSAVSKTVGEGVLDALDFVGVANLGIQDVNMSIASNGGSITLQASGSPYLGSRETKGFFQKQIKKAAEHVVLQTTATYFVGGGGAEFETRFGTKPIVVKKDRCIIRDQTGKLGPSFFTRTKYASGTTRNEVGATVGFDICVDDCTKPTRRFINLQGELLVAQTAVATTLSGELAMNGWWSNAFGSKMLNIGDLKFRLGLDMKTAPPVPTELELGGRVCLGKKEVCVDKTEKSGNYINALAYGGFSVTDPNQNYFLGMLSETTLDKVFAVLGDTMSPKYHSWRKQLPSKIMNSGLYPVKTDCTEQQALSPGLFPECFVRIAVAPSAAKQVKTSDGYITVRKGFSMSGRLNVAGFEVRAEAAISPTSYFVDVNMDPINIANIISITASEKDGGNFVPLSGGNDNKARNLQACIGECDSDIQCAAGLKCFQRNAYENIPGCVGAGNKGWDYCYNPKKTSVAIEKGPRFMIDLRAVPPTAAIDITGRIDIPKLNTYGDVLVKLNDEGFKLSTETKLFGFMQSNLDAWWSWDMKTNPQLGFRAALQDVSFAGVMEGVVDIIEDQIDKAFEFLDKVEGEMRKITSYLNNICKSLYDKKKIKKSIYLLCRPSAKVAAGIVKGAFSIAKGALEAAKRAIERLIDIAMKGMKAVEDIFYIKKLSVSGFVDGSFSNSRVGAEIAVKLFKKDQKPLILDLDLSDSNKWIANAAKKIWNGIKSTLKDIADLAKKAEKEFNKIKNAVSDAFKDAGKEIADWFGDVAKRAAKAVAKAAKKAAKKVGKALRRF